MSKKDKVVVMTQDEKFYNIITSRLHLLSNRDISEFLVRNSWLDPVEGVNLNPHYQKLNNRLSAVKTVLTYGKLDREKLQTLKAKGLLIRSSPILTDAIYDLYVSGLYVLGRMKFEISDNSQGPYESKILGPDNRYTKEEIQKFNMDVLKSFFYLSKINISKRDDDYKNTLINRITRILEWSGLIRQPEVVQLPIEIIRHIGLHISKFSMMDMYNFSIATDYMFREEVCNDVFWLTKLAHDYNFNDQELRLIGDVCNMFKIPVFSQYKYVNQGCGYSEFGTTDQYHDITPNKYLAIYYNVKCGLMLDATNIIRTTCFKGKEEITLYHVALSLYCGKHISIANCFDKLYEHAHIDGLRYKKFIPNIFAQNQDDIYYSIYEYYKIVDDNKDKANLSYCEYIIHRNEEDVYQENKYSDAEFESESDTEFGSESDVEYESEFDTVYKFKSKPKSKSNPNPNPNPYTYSNLKYLIFTSELNNQGWMGLLVGAYITNNENLKYQLVNIKKSSEYNDVSIRMDSLTASLWAAAISGRQDLMISLTDINSYSDYMFTDMLIARKYAVIFRNMDMLRKVNEIIKHIVYVKNNRWYSDNESPLELLEYLNEDDLPEFMNIFSDYTFKCIFVHAITHLISPLIPKLVENLLASNNMNQICEIEYEIISHAKQEVCIDEEKIKVVDSYPSGYFKILLDLADHMLDRNGIVNIYVYRAYKSIFKIFNLLHGNSEYHYLLEKLKETRGCDICELLLV